MLRIASWVSALLLGAACLLLPADSALGHGGGGGGGHGGGGHGGGGHMGGGGHIGGGAHYGGFSHPGGGYGGYHPSYGAVHPSYNHINTGAYNHTNALNNYRINPGTQSLYRSSSLGNTVNRTSFYNGARNANHVYSYNNRYYHNNRTYSAYFRPNNNNNNFRNNNFFPLLGFGLFGFPGYGYGYGGYGNGGYGGYGNGYGGYGGYGAYTGGPSVQYYDDGIPQNFPPPADMAPEPNDGRAHLHVLLPTPDAQVLFDGNKTTSTGQERDFTTPQLPPGQNFNYTITATWNENGQTLRQEVQARVRANSAVLVDFTRPQVQEPPANPPANPNPMPQP